MSKLRYGMAVLIVACSGERLNVGDDPTSGGVGGTLGGSAANGGDAGSSGPRGGTGGTSAGGSLGVAAGGTGAVAAGGSWATSEGCDTDPALSQLLGTWKGDLEDFYLQPVTTLTVVINGASSHGMCGTVTWGEGDPPAPATDADAAYPSEAYFNGNAVGYGGSPAVLPPIQAFPYAISQGAVRDKTVRFGTRTFEPWRSWCELQTSYHLPNDSNLCIPTWEYATDPGAQTCTAAGETYSLFKCYACGIARICLCDANACDADPGPSAQFALTLSDAGDEMTGPYSGDAYAGRELSYYLKHVQ